MAKDDRVKMPADLAASTSVELEQLESQLVARFDQLSDQEEQTSESIAQLTELADQIDAVRAERSARAEKAAEASKQADTLRQRIHGTTTEPEPDADDDTADGGDAGEGTDAGDTAQPTLQPVSVAVTQQPDAEAIAAAAAQGATAAIVAALGDRLSAPDTVGSRASALLSTAKRHAPAVQAPPPARLAITAGADIPGFPRGGVVESLPELAQAFHRRARGMPATRGNPQQTIVASIANEFPSVVDDRTPPTTVDDLVREMTSRDKQAALLAGGGWCAPSEVRYGFFNVACEDGMVDLPTVGVSRGGICFPVSPSLADVLPTGVFGGFSTTFANTSNPWLWTEEDDILTVTGSVNKPCVRVPCPTFDEVRLECYGICLTAGNLTNDAYPEATQNFLRLLMSAHAHAMNGRYIASMVGLATSVTATGAIENGGGAEPVYQQVLGSVALAATDYRARYGMCESDVLEVILPQWIVEAIRSDLAWRTGADTMLSVSRALIEDAFAVRRIRPQFVNDWQVRSGVLPGNSTLPISDWPQTVDFLIYAAGTFLRGNGLTLDLGIVRDSVLNAENDYTAAWSEECHLIAMVGHEARLYTVTINVNGTTGAASGTGRNV